MPEPMLDPKDNVVAINAYSFREFSPFVAYRYAPKAGIRYVDLPASVSGSQFVPELMNDDDIQRLKDRLTQMGVVPATIGVYADLLNPMHPEAMRRRIVFAEKMGVNTLISDAARKTEVNADEWRKLVNTLRYLGDYALDHGVRIAIETHVGLTHSGALAAKLLDEVDHPGVGVNYDTGNIYFYNDDVNPVDDVKLVANRVFAVHLKDTEGGKGDWGGFCDLGQGKVDLPAIIAVLQSVGFRGPYGIELEGKPGQDLNRDGYFQSILRSVDYLRKIGLLPARAE